jgi:hypothetical protein
MSLSSRTVVENRADYIFGCPEGTWTARLDNKARGNRSNLVLYLTEIDTGKKYLMSVFWAKGYRCEDQSICFQEVNPGAVLKMTTKRTKTGNPRVMSAAVISE